jgi:FtsP/CotA-like multicopper oxidase with cupredoxin domain
VRESALATHFSLSTVEGLHTLGDLFPPDPDQTFLLYSTLILDSFNHNIPTGSINKTSWKPQRTPLLALDRSQWDEHQLVPWTGSSAKWIDVVVNNEDDHGHPFHLHGFNFWVLSTFHPSAGLGATYNPFSKDAPPEGHKHFEYPVRKDTVYIPGRGYVVLRFRADASLPHPLA